MYIYILFEKKVIDKVVKINAKRQSVEWVLYQIAESQPPKG